MGAVILGERFGGVIYFPNWGAKERQNLPN